MKLRGVVEKWNKSTWESWDKILQVHLPRNHQDQVASLRQIKGQIFIDFLMLPLPSLGEGSRILPKKTAESLLHCNIPHLHHNRMSPRTLPSKNMINYGIGTSSYPIGTVIHPQQVDFSICHVPYFPDPGMLAFLGKTPTKPRPFWWSRAVCAIIPSTWWASSARHGCSRCRWPPSWVRSIRLMGESGEEWLRWRFFFGWLNVQKGWVLIGVHMQGTRTVEE